MKKTLIFLTLLIFTCKASATDRSYLIGEHSSSLFSLVGSPLEKMNNSLTGKSIWTYKDFKVLIRKDQVIQVLNLDKQKLSPPFVDKQANLTDPSTIQVIPTKSLESQKVDSAMLGEIMKELESKTVAGKTSTQSSKLQNNLPNSLQNNMLKFKE